MQIFIWIAVQMLVWGIVWYKVKKVKSGVTPDRSRRIMGTREETPELKALLRERARSLNMPLTEKARPATMEDIIGQEEGVRALRAAMCGPNPQHVIIYGPPGCGKTCAARLVLDEAKKREDSPFDQRSKFVEVDATCVRFDERAIADPLMGSVHDPIYQGAGVLGAQGVPQPKPGAVTRAHCGVLFLDEIGELHPLQMNKLLKVLEDRKVFFDSAYYSKDNTGIPPHIHEIFQHGLPADFRLVGATTRSPEELPPALRSRCVELYFNALKPEQIISIAQNAAQRMGCRLDGGAAELCAAYCESGRDVVNMVQLAGGAAYEDGREEILSRDVEWVARVCRCPRRYAPKLPAQPLPGTSVGLAVGGGGQGMVVEIECSVRRAALTGTLEIGGAVDEEEIELQRRKLRRKSTARASVENVCGAFLKRFNVDFRQLDIRFNVPGGIPMDGPSAGVAFAVALMSALCNKAPIPAFALTGELTVHGEVRPVGGVREKLEAAIAAGAKVVVIPEANWEEGYAQMKARVLPVTDISEVMRLAFDIPREGEFPVEWLENTCSA